MEQEHTSGLTTSEISQLWGAYNNDSALLCQLRQFEQASEDREIKAILLHACELSDAHLKTLKEIFSNYKFPIPRGFNIEEDVDLSAPKLFPDSFNLYYICHMSRIALQTYSLSLSYSVRPDIYSYFYECVTESAELLRRANELLLNKGIYVRPPQIPVPKQIDFIKKESFLTGFLGKRRTLTSVEINQLFANFERNAFGTSALMGFNQVAQAKEIKEFISRGKGISKKHEKIFQSVLEESDLPAPLSWTMLPTDSTSFTFSDKLILFYIVALISLSIGYYGQALAASPRRDLGVHYERLIQELLLYAEDGTEIMIQNGWLEQPPKSPDRDQLSK